MLGTILVFYSDGYMIEANITVYINRIEQSPSFANTHHTGLHRECESDMISQPLGS